MLIGSFLHNVDTKGRVFIPAKFRLDLGSHFYVYRSHDGCIRAYGEAEWKLVLDKLKNSTVKSNQLRRRILSSTVEVDMDSQGRVLIPEELRKFALIVDKVKIVGMADWVEFWNPDKFDLLDRMENEEEDVELMHELGMC